MGRRQAVTSVGPVLLALLVLLAGSAGAETSVRVGAGLYPRYTYSPMENGFELMAAEVTLQTQVTGETRDILSAVVQVYAAGVMHDWFRGIHFGEAYALFPLGLSLPTIRAGQAVVPFGLLADYDIHSQIVQTTYAKTLGLRLDPGLGILGGLGQLQYSVWVSNGNGPDRMDNDRNKLATARVAPRFLWGDADVSFGVSALMGSLPWWSLDSLAAFPEGPHSYRTKYRLGLDNTTDWGPSTIRLEGVVGRDSALSGATVFGYYAEVRYAFVSWLEGLAKYDGFHAKEGRANNLSVGLNLSPAGTQAFEIQTAYSRDFLKAEAQSEDSWRLIAQLVVRV